MVQLTLLIQPSLYGHLILITWYSWPCLYNHLYGHLISTTWYSWPCLYNHLYGHLISTTWYSWPCLYNQPFLYCNALSITWYSQPCLCNHLFCYPIIQQHANLLSFILYISPVQTDHLPNQYSPTDYITASCICVWYWQVACLHTPLTQYNIPTWYQDWLNWLGEFVEVYHVMLLIPKNCLVFWKRQPWVSLADLNCITASYYNNTNNNCE